MNIGIIIQARMGSTRLPGKALKKFAGREMLWHVVERCKKSQLADKVIVATSSDESDDRIAEFCEKHDFEYCRGSLEDVLARFYKCAEGLDLDTIVRITSDCPLIEPEIIDECIKLFEQSDADYVSNALNRIYPRGLDTEVFSLNALETAYKKGESTFEREHVTPYIVENMNTLAYEVPEKFRGDCRLTVDEEKDFELMSVIYDKFYKESEIINTAEVIRFLDNNPEIVKINSEVEQKDSIG